MTGEKRDCSCPVARHVHGTYAAYCNDDCRCAGCRAAWADYTRQRRRRVAEASWTRWPLYVTPHGTARRLQALAVIGYGANEIARLLNKPSCVVQEWRSQQTTWVYGTSAKAVADLYDRLWDTPSTDRYARKTRNLAKTKHWAPALAWDDDSIDDPSATPAVAVESAGLDEVLVQRLVDGDHNSVLRYSRSPERIEAIRRLAARGLTDAQIGQRVHMSRDAVTWARLRHGIPSGVPASREGTAA